MFHLVIVFVLPSLGKGGFLLILIALVFFDLSWPWQTPDSYTWSVLEDLKSWPSPLGLATNVPASLGICTLADPIWHQPASIGLYQFHLSGSFNLSMLCL